MSENRSSKEIMTVKKDGKKLYIKKFWLVYPLLALKVLIYYWQTDRLDMMNIYEVPILTFLFLWALFEGCSIGRNRGSKYTFYLLYTVITIGMFADAAYSSYFGKYISINQIYQLGSLGQVAGEANVLGVSVNPLCLLTLVDYPFVIALYGSRQKEKKISLAQRKTPDFFWYVGRYTLLFLAAAGCWCYYSGNPDELRSVQKVNHIEFFTYHANDFLVNVAGKMKRGEADQEAIRKTIRETVPRSSGVRYQGIARGKNLLLIQTESLNDFVLKAEYNGQELTPNLNALLQEDTLYFNHFYSTTGVGNTSDAEFAALNGLYPNEERECYRLYVDNTFQGLPWMLRKEGYGAMAFHGYVKTFWNREEAYKNQGFQQFYSQEKLNMTETAGFGLTDKEMFRQAVDILKEKPQPFFGFMITLTNHIPYELDSALASLRLQPSDENTTFGGYMQTVRYTDEAFGKLLQYLKASGLYENTMIVIYGDHQGMNMETPSVKSRMSLFLDKEYNYEEMLNVPLLIHLPGLGEARTVDTVGGQVDIMPTIANLMGVEPGHPFVFGQDLLNAEEGFVAQISYIGKGSFITGDNQMLFGIGKDGTVERGTLWNLSSGKKMNLNETLCQRYADRAITLLDTCKKVLDYNLIADYVIH